jgi:pimeloyl-ACP methyl ester carboxylesterase
MILNSQVIGQGETIVLIHGMAASSNYWQTLIPYLGKDKQIIAIDLLGYGHSPMPKDNKYDYVDHTNSITETLDHLGIQKPFVLVGHSMGGLLALRYAAQHPKTVKKLITFGMPVYASPEEARLLITGGRKSLKLAYYGPTSNFLCTVWCRLLRPLTKYIAPYYLSYLPRDVAADSLRHTWISYSRTMTNIIENQQVENDLIELKVPAKLVYGQSDGATTTSQFQKLVIPTTVELLIVKGDHHIPLHQPKTAAMLIN